ncbi:hypothetical protein [Panacibacter ginsenosidivorans]|uniref:hypothetical protein n=1 Tax=Panacibacter ginsenosidivorans TaxID=1813871 RepID=UPI001315340F|nr:hypothetical protein [Panacibacter ginsenosidivorans]
MRRRKYMFAFSAFSNASRFTTVAIITERTSETFFHWKKLDNEDDKVYKAG